MYKPSQIARVTLRMIGAGRFQTIMHDYQFPGFKELRNQGLAFSITDHIEGSRVYDVMQLTARGIAVWIAQ